MKDQEWMGFRREGSQLSAHQLQGVGSAVCKALATERFTCILQAPEGLS